MKKFEGNSELHACQYYSYTGTDIYFQQFPAIILPFLNRLDTYSNT